MIMLIYCVINVTNKCELWWMIYRFSRMEKSKTKKHDFKCLQHAATAVLNHKELGKNQKEYQNLNFLYINIIGKTNFQPGKVTEKNS